MPAGFGFCSIRYFCTIALLGALFITIPASPGLAALVTWNGGTSGAWSDGANWSTGSPPVDNDIVDYGGSSTSNLTQTNDLGDGLIIWFNLQSSLSNPVSISGDDITINSDFWNRSGQTLTIGNDLSLSTDIIFYSLDNASQNVLNGAIANNGNDLTFFGNTAGDSFTLGGTMTGAGGFICRSTAATECIVAAPQNYTGQTTIQNSTTLRLSGSGGLPDNGYLYLSNSGSCLDLNGVSDTVGSLSGYGSVLLGGATFTTGGNGTNSWIRSVISENGNLVKEGAGILALQGNNTYNGATTINGGDLEVYGSNIPDSSAVTVNSGRLVMGGGDETIGSLAGAAGTEVSLGTATLTTGGNNASTTFAGAITSTGGITKTGTGTFTLSGNNTYTGTTTINNGTLRLDAAERLNNASSMVVASGAAFDMNGFNETIANLSGAGTVSTDAGVLTVTTALSPGTSPGAITLGNVDLSAATLNVEIDGTTAGTGYDQIIASGDVTLGGTLTLTPSISPPTGTIFTIINKTSAGAVSGTFAGLAEGATISAGGATYKISYADGTGNDVTLTVQASSGGGSSGGSDTDDSDAGADTLPAPKVSQGSSPNPTGSLDGNALSWDHVNGASYYRVYRADCPFCTRKEIGKARDNSFVDNTAEAGRPYYYWLRTENDGGLGVYSNWMVAWRYEQNPGRAGDFNNDGIMDLLWWDPNNNQLSIWYLSGGLVQNASTPGDGLDIAEWLLIGAGDFNGDGVCDLLWWKPETGETLAWYLSNTTAEADGAGEWLIKSSVDLGAMSGYAAMAYTGDVNGDGRADILWRDYSSGDVTLWLMGEDGKPQLSGPPTPASDGITAGERPGLSGTLEWQVVGLDDADGDGKDDVIWKDARNNHLVTWLMDGSSITQAVDETKGLDTLWRAAGLGDLNADQQADIVWRNEESGAVTAWLMQAGKFLEERAIIDGSDVATQWQVKAMGDFCAPGCDDVYCKHSESSEAKIITLGGEEFTPTVE